MMPAFPRPRLTRRTVGRGLLLAGLLFPVVARGTLAGRAWCRTDPVVSINGELADVFVAGPPEAPLLVNGANEIVVTVPDGVKKQLVLNDLGFGQGNTVSFKTSSRLRVTRSGVEVKVAVRVPVDDSKLPDYDGPMPVRVEFAPRVVGILSPASAEGTANQWVTLRTTF